MNKTFTRREALGLLGSSLMLSACGASNSSNTGSSFDSESDFAAEGPNLPETVEVKVVDKVKQSYQSYNISEKWLETSYTYNDAGRLIQTESCDSQGLYDENTKTGWKYTYEYDEDGRVVSVLSYAEYTNWGLNYSEYFTYNDDGSCATYDATIESEGTGSSHYEYEYTDGLLATAKLTSGDEPPYNDSESNYVFSYDDKGYLIKATLLNSTEPKGYGLGLDEALSNTSNGVYAYRTTYDSIITLHYDDEGYLVSSSMDYGTGQPLYYEYVYKTITVNRSEWLPSIYSNPTGIDTFFGPQLSEKRKAELLQS